MSHSHSPRQLIVCGFHRSGTSLTMQALKNAGLFMGDNLMQAHPSNPDGHFEDREIVSLHDEVLSAAQRSWHSIGGSLTTIDAHFTKRANTIIHNYCEQSSVWGFKDPRTCLFLDWWKSMLPDAGAVLIYRNYLACYQSLRNREAQILTFNPNSSLMFWQDPHHGLRLWLAYNQALLAYVRSNRSTTILVSCEAMMSGYDLINTVNNKFNLSLDPESESGIRPKPHTSSEYRSVFSPVPETLLQDLKSTLRALNELADSPACIEPTLSPATKFDARNDWLITQSVLSELGIKAQPLHLNPTAEPLAQQAESRSGQNKACSGDDADSVLLQIGAIAKKSTATIDSQFVEESIARFPDNLKIRIAAGRYYLDRWLYKEAIAQFNYGQELQPTNPVSLLHLGFLENNRRHYLKAAHYFQLASNLQRHNAILYFHWCHALINARRLDSALIQCEQGLGIDPDNTKLNALKINILIQSDSIDKAEICCKKAIDHQPEEPEYYSLYFEIESLKGNLSEAQHYFYLSTWLKIKALPEYQAQLLRAIADIPTQSESQALRRQVNIELQNLNKNRQVSPLSAVG